jgi:hypothetical protein
MEKGQRGKGKEKRELYIEIQGRGRENTGRFMEE